MERIGLRRDPAGDFEHPRVDPVAHPHLVSHGDCKSRLTAKLGVAKGGEHGLEPGDRRSKATRALRHDGGNARKNSHGLHP